MVASKAMLQEPSTAAIHPLALLFVAVLGGLYWGLNQTESRAIYAHWDKLLHFSVFYLTWWMFRSQGPWRGWQLAVLLGIGGGLEELHQLYMPTHQADWLDCIANLAGISAALLSFHGVDWLKRAAARGRLFGQVLVWPYRLALTASFASALSVVVVALGWVKLNGDLVQLVLATLKRVV